MIGRTLAQYRIRDSLGIGGMGEVYLAKDARLGRKVALKFLPPELAADPERLERFEREARAIAALNHPNIVTLFSIEEVDGLRFFAMEVVDGSTLGELLPAEGFTLKRFFTLAVPLVDALAAAHDRQITHRDLKPANVMVDRAGRVKVLDFGLAKVAKITDSGYIEVPTRSDRPPEAGEDDEGDAAGDTDGEPTAALTEMGRILGSGPYMSPEQVRGETADPRSDVFALGILLYEMLTGQRPFRGKTYPALMDAIVYHEPPLLENPPEHWPDELGEILARCLEKDPKHRYPSARELRDDLSRIEGEFRLSVSLSRIDMATFAAARPKTRYRRLLAAAAGVVLLLLAGIFYSLDRTSRDASDRSTAERTAERASTGTGAAQRSRTSLAVLYFQNLNDDPEFDWLRLGLTDMLVTDLSRVPEIDVLSTDRLYAVLDEIGRLDQAMVDSDVIREVADRAGVEMVLVGSYARSGGRLRVSVKLQEAASGKILAAESREGAGEESVFSLVDGLSRELRRELTLTGTPSRGGIREVTTSSVAAYQAYVEGFRLHMQSRDEEAIVLLERSVEIDPDFALALTSLHTLHTNLGRERLGREYARRALELAERLPAYQRFYVEGKYYGARWQTYDRAIEAYERTVELYPHDHPARSALAMLYMGLERYDEAIAHYHELIEQGTDFAPTYYMLAGAYSAQNRFARGHEVLEEFLRREPGQWFALMGLGWHLTHWGRWDEASATFARAEAARAGEMFVRNGRWRLAVLREDWQGALRTARETAAAGGVHGRWRGLVCEARTRLYQGRSAEAIELFGEASRVYPEPDGFTAMGHAWAAEALLALGEPRRALEEAELARSDGRDEWPELQGLFLTALAREALGERDAADAAVRRLTALGSPRPNVIEIRQGRLLAGLLALERGDTERALRELRDAEALLPPRGISAHWHALPDHVPVWYALGRAELGAGRPDEAALWFERVTESTVEHIEFPIPWVDSFALLARIYDERGETERARELEGRVPQLGSEVSPEGTMEGSLAMNSQRGYRSSDGVQGGQSARPTSSPP